MDRAPAGPKDRGSQTFLIWVEGFGLIQDQGGVTSAEEEFDRTLRELLGPVRGYCERMLGHSQEAEDAAQQTFLQAYRAWSRFAGRSTRKTWIFRIATNVCAGILERRSRDIDTSGELDTASGRNAHGPVDGLESDERARGVRSALLSLKPAHRMVLVLFCIEGLSHTEISELLACPEGTVWSRLHHARKAFEEQLKRRGFNSIEELTP